MTTSTGTSPLATPQGSTASSSFVAPPWISPTSKATWPPGLRTRWSSRKISVITACQASSFLAIVSFTDLESKPRNQQRNQLSASYCTTSRKGGDVTTSATE